MGRENYLNQVLLMDHFRRGFQMEAERRLVVPLFGALQAVANHQTGRRKGRELVLEVAEVKCPQVPYL